MKSTLGTISIFNIYNDCAHSLNEHSLHTYINNNRHNILASENHHMIWAGDFNRHHPLWDNNNDTHLFTNQAINQASNLIELIANYGLNMALPKGLPTLQHMVTKKYSRPDNVFVTKGLSDLITRCKVDPSSQPSFTDHFPIVTNLQIPQKKSATQISYNFKNIDWDSCRNNLRTKLNIASIPLHLLNPEQVNEAIKSLTTSIQSTIKDSATQIKPRPMLKDGGTPTSPK